MGHIIRFKQFLLEDEGATAVEYGLIAALVAMVAIVGIQAFGQAMINMYSGSGTSLNTVIQTTGS
jgi:pilus assembly protein Flp/PilA